MIGPRHQALIDKFKAMAKKFTTISVLRNRDAEQFALAWESIPTEFNWTRGVTVPQKADAESWRLLWSAVRMDLGYAASITGLTRDRAVTAFGMLKGVKIIFPDGTVSKEAISVLTDKVQALIERESE